ncbi:DnaJ domain containing protein, expressed [Panicum miliaceum]|uniref:DnaJ domain containing protein, expressed n=1 Tax=Panicum miliaceum TaxID=4540 RepID=A0A3L6TNX4_PANMI|nr:DnaJ domain containing protein, expressed [Panicum miliaceum]
MAMTKAVAAATIIGPKMSAMRGAASFPFSPLNLILSSSLSFSPRLAFLSPRVPRLAMRSKRIAMDKRSYVMPRRRHGGVVAAASAAGSQEFGAGEIENPYEVELILGISWLDGFDFDQVKMVYKKKRKDEKSSCDREYLLKLLNQKKWVTYGSSQVSKDIRYAGYQPIVPWGPRYSRSTVKDLRINMAISAAFIMCISTMGHADWKPLQFLCFAYFYRILEKLKTTEPDIAPIYNEYGEVEGRGIHMARRVLRSLGLVLGSIIAASLGHTGLANFSQFLGQYIPSVVYNFQEQ